MCDHHSETELTAVFTAVTWISAAVTQLCFQQGKCKRRIYIYMILVLLTLSIKVDFQSFSQRVCVCVCVICLECLTQGSVLQMSSIPGGAPPSLRVNSEQLYDAQYTQCALQYTAHIHVRDLGITLQYKLLFP